MSTDDETRTAWKAAENGADFRQRLAAGGHELARDPGLLSGNAYHVVVDRTGEFHELANDTPRRVLPDETREAIRAKLDDLRDVRLPTPREVRNGRAAESLGAAWKAAENGADFADGLRARGLVLARDERGYVWAVDRFAAAHSLTQDDTGRGQSIALNDLPAALRPAGELPTVAEARAQQRQARHAERTPFDQQAREPFRAQRPPQDRDRGR